jgi:hypothetical protein
MTSPAAQTTSRTPSGLDRRLSRWRPNATRELPVLDAVAITAAVIAAYTLRTGLRPYDPLSPAAILTSARPALALSLAVAFLVFSAAGLYDDLPSRPRVRPLLSAIAFAMAVIALASVLWGDPSWRWFLLLAGFALASATLYLTRFLYWRLRSRVNSQPGGSPDH